MLGESLGSNESLGPGEFWKGWAFCPVRFALADGPEVVSQDDLKER